MDSTYWWRQFTGPTVSHIMNCIRMYLDKVLEPLDYFKKCNLDYAKKDQLGTLGLLLGVPRPVMELLETIPVIFTSDPGEGGEAFWSKRFGFADYELETDTPSDVGGVFSEVNADDQKVLMPLPDKWYRPLCKVVANSQNKMGSLGLLDEFVYALALADDVEPEDISYTIKPIDAFGEEASKVYGDIILDVRDTKWSDTLVIQTVLNSITTSMFAPGLDCLVRLELG